MPIAVIADVHGNLPALRAVLAEVRREGLEAVLGLGDLVSGPLPRETLDELLALELPWSSVRGNADRGAVEAFDGAADAGATHEDDVWAGQQLTQRHRDHLAALPVTSTLEVAGLGTVLLCHGTPRRDDEILLETTPEPQVRDMLAGVEARVVLCANTHMQFDRRVGERRVVNVGSVGWPYGEPGAYWAVLGPDVQLRRTEYDRGAAAAELRARSSWPRGEAFVRDGLLDPPSRQQALAVFEEMAARQRSAWH